MAWIHREPFWFVWPDCTNVFIGRQCFKACEALGDVRGQQEGVKRLFQVLMPLVIVCLDYGFFPGPGHALDWAIGPGVIGAREPVCNRLVVADTCQEMFDGIVVLCPVGELDTVIGQSGLEAIEHGRAQMTPALGGD
jgi:hypothetical protein